jgi:hypothetical protein
MSSQPDINTTNTNTNTLQIYKGNCHCGRYRFQVSLPADPAELEPVVCNCTLCTKRGFLWGFSSDVGFRVVRDDGFLVGYESAILKTEVRTYLFSFLSFFSLFFI